MYELLNKIAQREHLSEIEIDEVFSSMVKGELDPIQISGLLMSLRTKGETPAEIAGAAKALRDNALAFPRPDGPYVDVCGTGGDGSGSINISTATAIILAEMGISVTKHGNRSISSKCGSADLLEMFGIKLDPVPEVARRCLDEVGICFLFAPQYHVGLRHAMPVRKMLRVRTMFNILGPLVNPAAPPIQLMGVYDPELVLPIAKTLQLLGVKKALVVHGDGLDEISISGPTVAALADETGVHELEITPEQAGLQLFEVSELDGGDPTKNHKAIEALLAGKGAPAHEATVAINAGAAAWIAGYAKDVKHGAEMAKHAIRSGKALSRVQRWAEISHGA